MYDLDAAGWVMMVIVSLIVGFSKTGLPGCGILAVPLIAMVIKGQKSVGALLPMLIFADLFAILFYRRHVDKKSFLQLLPWAILGVILGYFSLTLNIFENDSMMNRFIGGSVILMLIVNLIRKSKPELDAKIPRNWAFAAIFGLLAGILTMMANGAGPIMMLYLLAMDFKKEKFIGTAAMYFAVVNLFKVPFHAHLGNITSASLLFSVQFFPILFVGAIIGRVAFTRIKQEWFILAVEVLTVLAGIKLLIG